MCRFYIFCKPLWGEIGTNKPQKYMIMRWMNIYEWYGWIGLKNCQIPTYEKQQKQQPQQQGTLIYYKKQLID